MKRFLTFLALLGALCSHAAAAGKPNVVIFLADDSGWGDYSFSGNTHLRTPNIDSIARAGASLDRFYVCAVCAPTRAEFFTGRYHSRGGVRGVSTGQERLNTDEKTLADAGATIALEFNGAKLTGQVSPGWDPPLYTNQDTINRPAGESQMKEFHPLPLGRFHLEKGRGLLTLRAAKIPGRNVMDVRQLNLTLRQ